MKDCRCLRLTSTSLPAEIPFPPANLSPAMASLRSSLRRLVQPPTSLPTSTSASHLLATSSVSPPLSAACFRQSVRLFASPSLAATPSGQAPRGSGSAVASLGLPTGMPALTTRRANDKTPMEFIAEVPPKEVDGSTATCDGGGGAMGHPVEYIQMNKVNPSEPSVCLYCGLRYVRKAHH